MRFLTLTVTSLALVALPLTACGKDSGSASSSNAASLVPASSLVYAEANLANGGDVDALLAKFPGGGGDAGGKIADLIEKGLREDDAPISYKDDIKPWLGDEVAFFVNGQLDADGDIQDGAALVATDDEDASMKAVDKAAEGKAKDATYKDHDYVTLPGDDGKPGAAGVVDGWLVVGTVSGYKGVVDASEGDGLEGSDQYEKAIADASDDRIGLVYLDSKAFYDIAKSQPGAESLSSFGDVFDQPYVVTLDADSDGAELAASLSDSDIGSALPFLSEGTDLVADVPADSWLALGQPELGKTVDKFVEIGAKAAGGRAALERQLSAATGGMTIHDLTGWMGDFAVFVSGDSVSDLSGALVIESTDEAASKKVLDKAKAFAGASSGSTKIGPLGVAGDGFTVTDPSVPQPVHVFQRDGKVVIAYGDAAAKDALGSADTLGDSAEFKSATSSLGGDYAISTWVAIKPILSLLESTPVANDAEWTQLKPYLEPLGEIVSGAKKDGDTVSSALRITVP